MAAYLRLEELEPAEPDWAKRVADCGRRLGRRELELAALQRAAEGYARVGFTVKAIALCKVILGLEPTHQTTQRRLAELRGVQRLGLDRLGSSATFGAAAPIGAPEVELPLPPPSSRASLPPGAPLEVVTVASLAPSLRTSEFPPQSALACELELGEIEWVDETQAAPGFASADPVALAAAARAYTPLFSEVSPESFAYLVEHLRLLEVEPGEVVFRQGDAPDALYVVAEGQVEVVAEGAPRERVNLLGEGDFFGEIGLLSDVVRQRTVAATAPSRLLVLDRRLVGSLLGRDPGFLRVLLRFLRERLVSTLIRQSELFAPFSAAEQQAIMGRFRFLELEPGTTLIEEGRRAEGLFVLLSGRAEVHVAEPPRVLATLGMGDVFGEMSLLSGLAPVAGVRTTQKAFALLLPAPDFTELVMTHPHVLLLISELAEQRVRQNQLEGPDVAAPIERHIAIV